MGLSEKQIELVRATCADLLARSGARAAVLCDATTAEVLATAGDASGEGEVAETERLSEHETVVRGSGGDLYGVDVPGTMLVLAVLHDGTRPLEVRLETMAAAAAIGEAVAPAEVKPPARKRPATRRKRAAKAPRKQVKGRPRKRR